MKKNKKTINFQQYLDDSISNEIESVQELKAKQYSTVLCMKFLMDKCNVLGSLDALASFSGLLADFTETVEQVRVGFERIRSSVFIKNNMKNEKSFDDYESIFREVTNFIPEDKRIEMDGILNRVSSILSSKEWQDALEKYDGQDVK